MTPDHAAPYHPGEQALQARAGTLVQAEAGARALRDHLSEAQQGFFAQLPYVVAAALDDQGWPWASLLTGPAGFITSPSAHCLELAVQTVPGDPLGELLQVGHAVGLLGIDLIQRRRNRLNGLIAASRPQLRIDVRQCFGNCPKYIQARPLLAEAHGQGACWVGEQLNIPAKHLIAQADTCFLASAHPAAGQNGCAAQGVDVSHRGGPPGFVRIEADGSLTLPDYAGNGYFNTLGNLHLHPKAGLLFVDFSTGHLLHIAADTELIWNGPAVSRTAGAERLLRLLPRRVLWREAALPLRWGEASASPFLP